MATPKTGDLLAGVPLEEQARILKLANAEWDAQFQAHPSEFETYTARQIADEARKGVILRELNRCSHGKLVCRVCPHDGRPPLPPCDCQDCQIAGEPTH